MTPKSSVLFLCTGNSCRSQMAEAIVNHQFGHRWQAFSAGSSPAGYVHPLAVRALSEMGIEHTGRSKSVDELRGRTFDLVITLCGEDEDQCPVWLGSGKKMHIPFPDPAKAPGSEEEQMHAFRAVRDGILSSLTEVLGQ